MDREWLSVYEATKRRLVSRRQSGQGMPPQEAKGINESIAQLDSQLKNMMASPMEYEIPASELARRQTLVENLQKQMALAPVGVTGFAAQGSGGIAATSSVSNPMAHSDRGLIQRQKDIMRLQDDMLVDIGQGVDRLHHQAVAIGEETKMQTRLLDDLEGHVDDTADALHQEANHASYVSEKSATCGMYICVAVEVVILIILIVVMVMA